VRVTTSRIILAAAAALWAHASVAQLTSDLVPRERLVPRGEQIRRDLEDARYHIGPFRVQPKLTIRDLGYNNNVFGTTDNPVSDWTATVAGGAHWTLPFGPKTYFRGDLIPEYTYYQKLTNRRFFGGTYNASALGLFNHLSLEATAGTAKNLTIVSSEIEAPVIRRTNNFAVDGELEFSRALSIFANVAGDNPRFTAEGTPDFELGVINQLDRNDRAARAGIRFRPVTFFDIGIGAEQTSSDFQVQPLARDNKSRAALLTMHYDRPRAFANVTVARRTGEASNGSIFPKYDTTTGSYFASYSLVAPIALEAYGDRRVIYGVFADYPYFFELRNGLGARVRVGNRLILRAFGEKGSNDYNIPGRTGGGINSRKDDVTTYGAGFAARMYRDIAVNVGLSKSEYISNLDAYTRSIVRLYTGITFSGGFAR
jgi:hypothetical protein